MNWEQQRAVYAIRGLSVIEKAVLCNLAFRASDKDGTCWPSQELIAEDTGSSIRAVRRAMKALADRGLIRRKRRHDKRGERTSDTIQICFEALGLPATQAARDEKRLPAPQAKPTGHTGRAYRPRSPGNSKGIVNRNNSAHFTVTETPASARKPEGSGHSEDIDFGDKPIPPAERERVGRGMEALLASLRVVHGASL